MLIRPYTLVLVLLITIVSTSCTPSSPLVASLRDKGTRVTIQNDYANSVLYAAGLPPIKRVSVPADVTAKLRKTPSMTLDEALVRTSLYSWAFGRAAPISQNWFIYWIPQDEYEDISSVLSPVSDALPIAVAATTRDWGALAELTQETTTTSLGLHFFGVSVRHPGCVTDGQSRCFLGLTVSNRPIGSPGSLRAEITLSSPPPFVGEGAHYLARGGAIDSPVIQDVLEEYGVDTLSFWTDLSKELPDTAYIYLAPDHYTVRTLDGDISRGTFPILLNSGVILTFFKESSHKPMSRRRLIQKAPPL